MKKIILTLLIVLLLMGCHPAPIEIQLIGDHTLNCTPEKISTPVSIWLYQLKNINALEESNPLAWYHNSATKTVPKNLYQERVILAPGVKVRKKIAVMPGVHWLMIIPEFQNPDAKQWRVLLQTSALMPRSQWVSLYLKNNKISQITR